MNAGSVSQPRTVDVGDSRALSRSISHFGKAREHLIEGDASLHAGESGPHAQVDPVAERQMPTVRSMDVERVPVGKATIVPVGRADEEEHHASRGHRRAVNGEILAGDAPSHVGRRGLKAEDLLDGVRNQRTVLDELSPLIRMVRQHLGGPSDETSRRLVSGAGQDLEVGQQFVPGQASRTVPVSSANSTLSSSVMMSSEGCSARQST